MLVYQRVDGFFWISPPEIRDFTHQTGGFFPKNEGI